MIVLAVALAASVAVAVVAVHLLRVDPGNHAEERLTIWSAAAIVRDFATDVLWDSLVVHRRTPSKAETFGLTFREVVRL